MEAVVGHSFFGDPAVVRYVFYELEHFLDKNLYFICNSGRFIRMVPARSDEAYSF